MVKELGEKVVMVTGAGQGVGEGIALCFGKRGIKVGRVVEFLAGPDSKYLSGQSILVDGGFSIMP